MASKRSHSGCFVFLLNCPSLTSVMLICFLWISGRHFMSRMKHDSTNLRFGAEIGSFLLDPHLWWAPLWLKLVVHLRRSGVASALPTYNEMAHCCSTSAWYADSMIYSSSEKALIYSIRTVHVVTLCTNNLPRCHSPSELLYSPVVHELVFSAFLSPILVYKLYWFSSAALLLFPKSFLFSFLFSKPKFKNIISVLFLDLL